MLIKTNETNAIPYYTSFKNILTINNEKKM